MNKHIVKYLLALATIAFVGGGCNVDDYNEEYLDGFNPDKAEGVSCFGGRLRAWNRRKEKCRTTASAGFRT